ncbi:MAG: hypothetical protein ACE5GA_03265 [Candidatus Zixiibacteriota bacterium]
MKLHYSLSLTLLCALLAVPGASLAAVPQTISYQGFLTDAMGDPLPDGPIRVTFIIWDDPVAGAELWNSGSRMINLSDGSFEYALGSATSLPNNLFGDTIRYLGITVDTDPEMSPRHRFRVVPYAYQALRADTAKVAATVFDGAITSVKLAPGSVKSAHIGAGEVTSAAVGLNAVDGSHVVDGSLSEADLDVNSVTASEIATGAVGTLEALDNSLTAADLAPNSVGSSEIAPGAVGTLEVLDNSLTAADLAANSIESSEISTGAVTSIEVLDNSLTQLDLAANSVAASEIVTAAVGSAEIADNSVTSVDILNGAINGDDIASGSVFDIDMGDEPGVAQNVGTASISTTTLTSLSSRAIVCPTSGFILAIASCEASVNHISGLTSSALFGVSRSATSAPADQDKELRIASTVTGGIRDFVVSAQKIFNVASGVNTIHFVGRKTLSTGPGWTLNDITLSLVFIPTSYGTVTETPPSQPGAAEEEQTTR